MNNLPTEYQSIKGMPDILAGQAQAWFYLEQLLYKLMVQYGYSPIRLPLLEKTSLFKRAIGDTTEVIEKEMFTFLDEKGRSLSLRPEGTASCVRACIEHGLLSHLPKKLWYMGPMFRYESPQKGRQRQFHQLGVECFGVTGFAAEVEQITMFTRLWQQLGIDNVVQLEINNLGTSIVRKEYSKALIKYFNANFNILDEDSKRRLNTNPLRILDSKNPTMQDLIKNSPKLYDFLDQESIDNYNNFKQQLFLLKINFIENHNIVRGLDYYTGVVWEWTSHLLGAQTALGGGGRYDGLVGQLSGNNTGVPAVGLALGLERILLVLKETNDNLLATYKLDGYLITVGDEAILQKFVIAEQIRNLLPEFNLMVGLLDGNFKTQFKRADKSGAIFALVVGNDEISSNSITVKYLRATNKQQINIKLKDLSYAIMDK